MDNTALYKLSYGLYVVGVKTPKWLGGCIVDSVAQVAVGDAPVILLAAMKNNLTTERIKAEKEFTLSVLPENVDPFVIANFGFQSARDADKWANVPHTVKDGLPILDNAVSYLRCRVTEAKELATHTAFFCELVDAWNGQNQAKPLIYGDYQRNMKNAASDAFKKFKENGKTPETAPKAAWRCKICGYEYDGAVPFEDLPADWKCPLCGVGKEDFEKTQG
jgi:flavin reductase (DIM6/NTAB) family NADH-FMN oxidoreductase RutF/rubredoxin